MILPGAIKLDLLFEDAHEIEAAWYASAETLPAIDRHFWDWTLWLGGKQLRGQLELVSSHLSTLSVHLLQPFGVETKPRTLGQAVSLYMQAREEWSRRLPLTIPTELGAVVQKALIQHGIIQPAG